MSLVYYSASNISKALQNQDLIAIENVNVTVTNLDGDIVLLYTDKEGSPKSNPFTADDSGMFGFYVEQGQYIVNTEKGGNTGSIQIDLSGSDYKVLNNSFNTIAGRMWAGEAIKLACFGDSTTDGNNTTDWVRNPTDGSGNAIGNSDHNLTAPNAWPIKLQDTLREIFKNNSIEVWNAGYSGKRVDDGWAVANYQQAVIDNPFYGLPDLVLIGFGLNDIQGTGSQIDDHLEQMRILIERILSDGSLPVLLTTDAEFRNGTDSTRDQKEAKREIDAATISLAHEYSIEIIDFGQALKDWIQNNTDGFSWAYEQDDGLHFGDNGHKFKSSYAASKIFQDTVIFNGGSKAINTWDSASSYVGSYVDRYKFSNNKQGGNILFSSGAPTNTDVVDLLIWNEAPNANLIYLGVDHEFYDSYTTAPAIVTKDFIGLNENSKNIISVGGYNADFRRSDEHFIHSKLKYGLNKITYKTGDSSTLFYGGFKLVDSISSISSDVLNGDEFRRGYNALSGIYVDPIEELPLGANTAGAFDGETVSISFDAILPRQSAILLMYGQGFTGTQQAIDDGLQSGTILFRADDDKAKIYAVKYNDLGTVVFSAPLLETPALSWHNDNIIGRFELSRLGGNQNIRIFNKFRGGSSIASAGLSLSNSIRWAGFVGGTFYNSDNTNNNASVQISRLVINRDYEAAKLDPDEPPQAAVNLIPLNNEWSGTNEFTNGYTVFNGDSSGNKKTWGAVVGASGNTNTVIFGGSNNSNPISFADFGLVLSPSSFTYSPDGVVQYQVYHEGNKPTAADINAASTTDDNLFLGNNIFSGGYVDCDSDYEGNIKAYSAVMGAAYDTGVVVFGVRNNGGSGVADAGLRMGVGVFEWYDSGVTYKVYHEGNFTGVPSSRLISSGAGISGGGDLSADITIEHGDTSAQSSVNNSGSTVIQDITLDEFGHITNIGSKTLSASDIGAGSLSSQNTWTGDNYFNGEYIACKGTFGGGTSSHAAVMGPSFTSGRSIFGTNVGGTNSGANYYYSVDASNIQYNNGSSTFTIWHSGNLACDSRLKEDLKPIESALDKINTLTGYTYKRKDLGGRVSAGLVAQELKSVLPEAVSDDEFQYKLDKEEFNALTVNPNAVIALLLEGIKELRSEINEIKERL